MRKFLTAGAAVLTLAGSMAAITTPAQAQRYHYYNGYRGYHRDNDWGVGVGAGLAGLALGAALASPRYDYDYGYGPGYYYGPGYGECVGTRRVWDPYYGGWTVRRYYYAC
jgi:hypothetical protein